jgi:PPOX class probable F420-dependent enzyme
VSASPMSESEWLEFLRSPARPAIVSTVRRDGRPHAVPVWFDLDGTTVVFNTGAHTVKGRNLARDPRLGFCVQDDALPYAFLAADGVAELIDDLEQVRRWAARIGGRYMGADQAEALGERNGVPGELLVRVELRHVVAIRDLTD